MTELHEEQALVRKVLRKLPAEEQELYRLWCVEELSTEQIARKLGCYPVTVRQRKKRLRGKLDKEINKK
ncbi:MAG: sigma-70 family RNA polymerase sigma factor [Acidobacteria bacterium]|nr:sigma-70 family RNA polymerase sigma factor [Acidobacteriota bacterium]